MPSRFIVRFIPHFSFSEAIAILQNFFSILKADLNDYFKYCFLAVTIFTSTLFIGFSLGLPNIALLLNFVLLYF